MRVLVTGGAGYIGSHTVVHLIAAGHEPVIVDSLVNAKPAVLDRLEQITGQVTPFVELDLRDADGVEKLFASDQFDAVIHFAGLKAAGESVEHPLRYYENNLGSTFVLVDAMQRHGVGKLVFSSSALVYGDAQPPMSEETPTSPPNPYGATKVMIERILQDISAQDPQFRVALLRYFNPVGAHPSGLIGEDPRGIPNNLVPFIAQVAVGRREKLLVFGDDYPTPDGTCQRDYIHVEDLAAGHIAALARLEQVPSARVWNLGTGKASSVLDVLAAFERAVGHPVPNDIVGRRPGDPPVLCADPRRANTELGWRAERSLDDMCADAWRWQSNNPTGYPDRVA
jgi:UDP-glucose 4-epimerase